MPMQQQGKSDEAIIKRLNVLIAILLEQSPTESTPSMTDKIVKLVEVGVPPADIAKILGKPLNYVTAVLSQRKSRKKKGKANG